MQADSDFVKIPVPYYQGGIGEVVPKGHVSLRKMLMAIGNPSPGIIQIMAQVRKAADKGDIKEKERLKRKLPFFTPAVNCSYRDYEHITGFTGLAALDFDNKDMDNVFAIELKEELFSEHQCIIAAWLSSSGKGVRALFRIPDNTQTINEFKGYYHGFGMNVKRIKGYDVAPQNPVLPLYLSIDTDILVRKNYTIWKEKYIPPPPPPPKPKSWVVYGDKSQLVAKRIERAIQSKISVDGPGFVPLRRIAFWIGGYVASGYLTKDQAEDIFSYHIDNHPYLRIERARNIKVVKDMLIKGQNKPITL